jgi:multicomponent Na+:H+ antiporter subunit G
VTPALTWLADGLVVAGLAVLTASVIGLARMRAPLVRLHAASKATFLGLVPLLLAAAVSGQPAMLGRATLILVFLVLTTPVASHAIARAVAQRRRRRRPPAADRP